MIWTNVLLTEPARELLIEATKSHRLFIADQPSDVLAVGAAEPSLEKAQIVFGQPPPELLERSQELRWLQLSSAGFARYDTMRFREAVRRKNAVVTNSSSVFDEPCAEHVAALLLADSRQLYPSYDNQKNDRGWPQNHLRENVRLLADQIILIIGFGAIGRRLAELLAPYKVTVIGYRRTPQPGSPIPIVGQNELSDALAKADHVINILPESASTVGFFDTARFAQMKPGSRYYSIGRGPTTDQIALREALETNRLSAAYLDVTDPEPLPADHFLWKTPNCYVTPHISGGHTNESVRNVQHFADNLNRYDAGKPLIDRIF
jgi:phosphoglycerate dehydrogenase-like enzyme